MKNRLLYVLAWIGFLPTLLLFLLILGIPVFIFTGKSTFVWINNYLDWLIEADVNAKMNLTKKSDFYE